MLLELVWSLPPRQHPIRWLAEAGDGTLEASPAPPLPAQYINIPVGEQELEDAIATFFPGGIFAPVRLDAPLAGTWTLAHGLGRIPTVQVFLSSGEAAISDVHVDLVNVVVTWATPQQGFVLAF
jgi:hypothetical protein